jgi:hypothetical protein
VLKVTPSPLSLWALVGAMLPISNTPGSVAVWATVSEFNQFTVWPTFTVTGFGEYTPFLIVTVSRFGGFTHSGFVGVGVHGAVGIVVLVGLDELPHPTAKSANRTTAPTVDRVVALESLKTMFQRGATPVPSRQAGPLFSTTPARRKRSCGSAAELGLTRKDEVGGFESLSRACDEGFGRAEAE